MIEYLIHIMGWCDLWYAHPGYRNFWKRRFGGRWHAGVWTGPDNDMICVARAVTREDAERLASPGAYTILGAILKAATKRCLKKGIWIA
jgi:hypothetical protein